MHGRRFVQGVSVGVVDGRIDYRTWEFSVSEGAADDVPTSESDGERDGVCIDLQLDESGVSNFKNLSDGARRALAVALLPESLVKKLSEGGKPNLAIAAEGWLMGLPWSALIANDQNLVEQSTIRIVPALSIARASTECDPQGPHKQQQRASMWAPPSGGRGSQNAFKPGDEGEEVFGVPEEAAALGRHFKLRKHVEANGWMSDLNDNPSTSLAYAATRRIT